MHKSVPAEGARPSEAGRADADDGHRRKPMRAPLAQPTARNLLKEIPGKMPGDDEQTSEFSLCILRRVHLPAALLQCALLRCTAVVTAEVGQWSLILRTGGGFNAQQQCNMGMILVK